MHIADREQTQVILKANGYGSEEAQEEMLNELIQSLEAHKDEVMGTGDEHYQTFMDEYFIFYQNLNNGTKPKVGPANGKALKELIKYLRRESKTGDYEGAFQSWQYILNNWKTLGQFLANQTSLILINKNINEIITTFRNGTHDKKTRESIKQTAEQELDDSLAAIIS